jgi:hypothetical protein
MSDQQPGTRTPTHPTKKPTKSVETEENPIKYDTFSDKPMQSGSKGGGYEWTSHPRSRTGPNPSHLTLARYQD